MEVMFLRIQGNAFALNVGMKYRTTTFFLTIYLPLITRRIYAPGAISVLMYCSFSPASLVPIVY